MCEAQDAGRAHWAAMQILVVPLIAPVHQSASFVYTTFYGWRKEAQIGLGDSGIHSNVRPVILPLLALCLRQGPMRQAWILSETL